MAKKVRYLKFLLFFIALAIPYSISYLTVSSTPSTDDIVDSASLSKSRSGFSTWSKDSSHAGTWSIHLGAPGKATWDASKNKGIDVNEGRISIKLAPDTKLGDIESISWWVNTTSGYPPHIDFLLDLDGDGVFDGGKKDLVTGKPLSGMDEVLVAELAYQPYLGPGYEYISPGAPYGHYDPTLQSSYYNPSYRTWVKTFQNHTSELDTTRVDNETVCWVYSGLPGPYEGGYFGTLRDFKDGVVQLIGKTSVAPVNASVAVLEIQIEVDNWLGASEAYVDDIALNGESLLSELVPPEIDIIQPKPKTYLHGDIPLKISSYDLFGVDKTWYNVKDDTGEWAYAKNQFYTSTTNMVDFSEGDYQLYVWSNNTLGVVGLNKETRFFVRESELTVEISPKTLNLKSNGRWITVKITPPNGYMARDIDASTLKLKIGGEIVTADWTVAGGRTLLAKFSRHALHRMLPTGDEVEIAVLGDFRDDTSFVGYSEIRVRKPGRYWFNLDNMFDNLRNNGKERRKSNSFQWSWPWGKINKGKGVKNNGKKN